MLTTQFAGGLRARPLEARPDRGSGLIFFVTDIHSAKEDEIKIASDIGLVSIDAKDKAYLSITGRAIRDPEKIKAAWRKSDEVLVAGRSDQSRGMLVTDRTSHGGIVGRTGERCPICLRVCQVKIDWKGTDAGREPKDYGQVVSRICQLSNATSPGPAGTSGAARREPRRGQR